jgi:hypothetical protein
MKVIIAGTAAALVVWPLSLTLPALSQAETVTRADASNTAVKGDRLDIGTRGAAYSQFFRCYFDSAWLYDSMRPAGEVHKVRTVSPDRLSVTK